MAHNDFENNIRSRFQSFESKPPESVWTNINNARSRRKKRFLFFWWLIPFLLIAGSTLVFFHGSNYSTNKSGDKHKNTDILTTKHEESDDSTSKLNKEITSKIPDKNNVDQSPIPKNRATIKKASTPYIIDVDKLKRATKKDASISLQTMRALPVEPENIDLEIAPCWLDPNLHGKQPIWRRSLGIQLGSFLAVSRIEEDLPPSNSLTDPSMNSGASSYFRFLEVSPYVQWQNRITGLGFRANALYTAATFSKQTSSEMAPGQQQSFGLGAETNYTFIQSRWNLSVYLKFQGERVSTRYTGSSTYDWGGGSGGSVPWQSVINESNATYRQWILAGEAGLHVSYVLPNPYWRIHSTFGYRNYFWQQSISNNSYLLEIPQLIHLGLGISRDF